MSMEPIVHRIKVALDVAPADPGLRARVISSLPLDRRQAHRARLAWAGPVAVVLAVAVVAGLISVGAFRARAPSYSGTVDVGDCRLPVYGTAKGPAQPGPGLYEEGFLNLSTGEFTPATPPSTVQTDQVVSPIGWFGANRGISYDPVVDQWLPVPLAWIAPDGLSYAYLTGSVAMNLRLRDLRTGSDRVLMEYRVTRLLGWVGERIYYVRGGGYEADLWEVDPKSGREREVSAPSLKEWWLVGPGSVWGSAWYSGSLSRYDVATGTTDYWNIDRILDVIGIDSFGHPFVLQRPESSGSDPGPNEGYPTLMLAPNRVVTISPKGQLLPLQITVIPDGDRTWFSAAGQRIWVYTTDKGLVFLDESANKSLPDGLAVAGGCV